MTRNRPVRSQSRPTGLPGARRLMVEFDIVTEVGVCDLQGGIEEAERVLGFKVIRSADAEH